MAESAAGYSEDGFETEQSVSQSQQLPPPGPSMGGGTGQPGDAKMESVKEETSESNHQRSASASSKLEQQSSARTDSLPSEDVPVSASRDSVDWQFAVPETARSSQQQQYSDDQFAEQSLVEESINQRLDEEVEEEAEEELEMEHSE